MGIAHNFAHNTIPKLAHNSPCLIQNLPTTCPQLAHNLPTQAIFDGDYPPTLSVRSVIAHNLPTTTPRYIAANKGGVQLHFCTSDFCQIYMYNKNMRQFGVAHEI